MYVFFVDTTDKGQNMKGHKEQKRNVTFEMYYKRQANEKPSKMKHDIFIFEMKNGNKKMNLIEKSLWKKVNDICMTTEKEEKKRIRTRNDYKSSAHMKRLALTWNRWSDV